MLADRFHLFCFISQVHAIDRDAGENGTVNYYIQSNSNVDFIHLDRWTGALSLSRELSDSEIGEYIIYLEARDRGTTSMSAYARLAIDVNDESPKGLLNMVGNYPISNFKANNNAFNFYIIIFTLGAAGMVAILMLFTILLAVNRHRQRQMRENDAQRKKTTNAFEQLDGTGEGNGQRCDAFNVVGPHNELNIPLEFTKFETTGNANNVVL